MSLFLRTYFEGATAAKSSALPPHEIDDMESLYRAAHDIRSPLSALNMTTHYFKTSSPQLEHLEILDEAVRRINKIAEEILCAREKRKERKKSRFDFVSTLRSFILEAQRPQHRCAVEAQGLPLYETSKMNVLGDADDFLRILWNLFQNSQEAKANCVHLCLLRVNNTVILKIRDNGQGIPGQVLKQIGREGFTTKSHGHGLGLYGAIKMLRNWKGSLKLNSQPGVGTTIEIQMPLLKD